MEKITDIIEDRTILEQIKEKDSIVTWIDLDRTLRAFYGMEVFIYPLFGDKVGYDTWETLGYYSWCGVKSKRGYFLTNEDLDPYAVAGRIREGWPSPKLFQTYEEAWIEGLKELSAFDFKEPYLSENYDFNTTNWPEYVAFENGVGDYCIPLKKIAPGTYRHLTFPKYNVVHLRWDGEKCGYWVSGSTGLGNTGTLIKNKRAWGITPQEANTIDEWIQE